MHFDCMDFVVDSKLTTDAFTSNQQYVTQLGHVLACHDSFSKKKLKWKVYVDHIIVSNKL